MKDDPPDVDVPLHPTHIHIFVMRIKRLLAVAFRSNQVEIYRVGNIYKLIFIKAGVAPKTRSKLVKLKANGSFTRL